MWRKRLRLGIALFVVIFAVVVGVSLRNGRRRVQTVPAPNRIDRSASIENTQGGVYERTEHGKVTFSLKFGSQLTYPDGRSKLGGGVDVSFLDKDGKTVRIKSQEATLFNPPDQGLTHAVFQGGVTLSTSDGVTLTGAEGTYDKPENTVRVPGPIKFTKGRMTGTGNGAVYDFGHEVLSVTRPGAGRYDRRREGRRHRSRHREVGHHGKRAALREVLDQRPPRRRGSDHRRRRGDAVAERG